MTGSVKFVHRYISELLLCEWKILLRDFFDILSSLHAGKLKELKDEHTRVKQDLMKLL